MYPARGGGQELWIQPEEEDRSCGSGQRRRTGVVDPAIQIIESVNGFKKTGPETT